MTSGDSIKSHVALRKGWSPLIIGGRRNQNPVAVPRFPETGADSFLHRSDDDVIPGDWVYFNNSKQYRKGPYDSAWGPWQGENAVFQGLGKYTGFGIGKNQTAGDIRKRLINEYRKAADSHHVPREKTPVPRDNSGGPKRP